MLVTENLMQFIWKLRLFHVKKVRSTEGISLDVVHVGQFNTDAGPDFLMSHIKIGRQDWHGHVELHIRSSDWERHQHQNDELYNNVILHVVWVNDKIIKRKDGTQIPTLVLSKFIEPKLLEKYAAMMNVRSWVPCEAQLSGIDDLKKSMWLDVLSYERLEMRVGEILLLLDHFGNDWEKIFWIWTCRCMGLKVNAHTFQELGEKLPLEILQKYRSDLFKIEALFFGISGLIPDGERDSYAEKLHHEFNYQKNIHGLRVVHGAWKRLRMRPYNFPELRIAQLAVLFSVKGLGVSKILGLNSLEEARELFNIGSLNSYWKDHFSFNIQAIAEHSGKIGRNTIDILIINIVVLFLFTYGKYYGIQDYMDKAVFLLEMLPKETNVVIRNFSKYGLYTQNAFQSQGILQLKTFYCERKQCLHCRIGVEILQRS